MRLQLHALVYNLGNFLHTLATPEPIKDWSLTTLKDKLIKIGAKVVSHGRYIVFQMAEVAIPRQMIQEILQLIANCGCCRRRHRHETSDLHASTTTNGRNASESPRKMARQTLERDAGACCAGSRPYLGSGLLGSPENRYNLTTSEFIGGIPVELFKAMAEVDITNVPFRGGAPAVTGVM